jgi:hypothetical protein
MTTATETKGTPGFEPGLQSAALATESCTHATALRRPGGHEGMRLSARRSCVREAARVHVPGVEPGSQAWEARVILLRYARSHRHRANGRQHLANGCPNERRAQSPDASRPDFGTLVALSLASSEREKQDS